MATRNLYKSTNPWQYFALALGLSWFFWGWIIVFHWNVWEMPGIVFGALGLFGPAIAELILISQSKNRQLWKDYLQRLFDIRRIGWKWLLIIIITFPLINGLSLFLCYLTDGHIPEFSTAKHLIGHPLNLIPYLIFILLFGPLPEELGWRGYALDALQSRHNALRSSIILGIVWATWHIPLFFMPGTFQHDKLGFATLDFRNFIVGTIIVSILFTWIYNNTNRSTLAAILFHFMINLSGELIPVTKQGRLYSLLLTALLSTVVLILYGAETLTGSKNPKQEKNSGLGVIKRFFGQGTFPWQAAFWLDFPLRRLIISPEVLADRLRLQPNFRVLEIGPGPGYFSIEVARRLPEGHLELLDIQPEMLEKVRKKLSKVAVNNISFKVADATTLPYEDNAFDVVFMVAVLGEIPDKESCLSSIYRVLKPGGLLSITEQPGDPDLVPLETIKTLAKDGDFILQEVFGKRKNFTVNFVKPGK